MRKSFMDGPKPALFQFNFIIPQVAWGLIAATTSTTTAGRSGNSGKRRKKRRRSATAGAFESAEGEGLDRDGLLFFEGS